MKHPRFLSYLGCLLLVAGCESPPAKPVSVETSMSNADLAIKGGQPDRAIRILQQAAAEHPTAIQPLQRIAQMQYERGNYGEAIVHATSALQREPDDLLANSIAAVSGLRVASKALADLSERNRLSGSVRSEAEDLAKLLRTTLGEEVLVPKPKPQAKPPARTARNRPDRTKDQDEDATNPFGSLR